MNAPHPLIGQGLDGELSTTQLHLFPLYYPDELHASQASRYHEASGNSSIRYSYQEMYDSAPFRTTYLIPLRLERFAAKLPGSLTRNIEALLRQNTLFPLFETFGNARLNLTNDAMPIANQIVNMPKRIVGESGKIHLCTDCLQSDREEFGQPYIHCAPQIPGVQVCWRHKTRLISSCPNCGCPFERKNEFVLAPWKPCDGCGLRLADAPFYMPNREASPQELSYANFARDMLLSQTKPLKASELAAIYKARIAELGYARKTRIDHQGIVEALEDHFGEDLLAQIDTAYRNKKNQQWSRFGSASTIVDVPLPRHLALSLFLFGSAAKFWTFASHIVSKAQSVTSVTNSCASSGDNSMSETNYPKVIMHPDPISTSQEPLPENQSSYARIEAILRENSGWTEKELWKTYPGLMKDLLRNNANGLTWLKDLIESLKTTTSEMQLQKDVKQDTDDLQWAQNFATVAIALYASMEKPQKISRNFLMRKAGWSRQSMPDHRKFPLARQQLESLKESDWHFYARRMVWAKLRSGAANSSCQGAMRLSGIEHHQGRAVLEFFSSVSHNRKLGIGTIMEILSEHKIAKDWEGPARGLKFLRPGRNSSRGGQDFSGVRGQTCTLD